MFESISSIAKENGGGSGRNSSQNLTDVVLHKSVCKTTKAQLSFVIGSELALEARFIPGDRVDILFDRINRKGLIRRVTDGGYKLIPRSQPRKGGKATSKTTLVTKLTQYAGMPDIDKATAMNDSHVTTEGIEFVFPEDVQL